MWGLESLLDERREWYSRGTVQRDAAGSLKVSLKLPLLKPPKIGGLGVDAPQGANILRLVETESLA
jgi:hypothetical protein